MVLSTPIKAASGVAVVSTAVAGTALTYKYSTDLYAIEKLALDEGVNWQVKQEPETNPKKFIVSVTASATKDLATKYGVLETGTWTCVVSTTATSTEALKTKLQTEFGITAISSTNSPTDNKLKATNKSGFLNSCARNRKPNPSRDKVASELILPETKPEDSLDSVFKGDWENKQ